jgi:hypothetical protein
MNRGGARARSLNFELQAVLNPAGERKVVRLSWTCAPGDKLVYTQVETIPYSQFEQLLNENKISEVLVGHDSIQGTLKQPLPDILRKRDPGQGL